MLAPGGVAYVSTPNLLTLAPPGAEKSDNPWHVHEYRAEEFRALCERHFPQVELLGLFHARKLRAHELALKLGWDRVHKRLGLTKPFYDRFTPAIAASDFRLRDGDLDRALDFLAVCHPGRMSGAPTSGGAQRGDLAIVLHSHMPYVEGFGTYPFGEEWLFDAVIRSYLPVLEVARDLTMTVTPVLADQLEDAGAAAAAARVPGRAGGSAPPKPTCAEVPAECRPACEAELRRYRRALELLDAAGGDPLAPVPAGRGGGAGGAGRLGRHPRGAAAAGDPRRAAPAARRRPALAPPPLRLGRRLLAARVRLRAGARAARWPSTGSSGSASTRAPTRSRSRRCARSATEAGPVALPIDWEAISWLWSLDGYPSDPAYAQFDGKSLRGIRLWRIGGGAYDPAAAAARGARARRTSSSPPSPPACARYAGRRGRRGLLVFAIDTELLGHWWSEGPLWLAAVLERRRGRRGRACSTVPRGAGRARAGASGRCAASSWGEGKDLRTWDSPPVADLAWGGAAAGAAAAAGARAAACAAHAAAPRRARAARRPGQRLGLPRPARPGRRLRLPARHRPRARRCWRP